MEKIIKLAEQTREMASIIARVRANLMLVTTKHSISLGIAMPINPFDKIGLAIGIHEEDNCPILKDIIGHIVALSKLEVKTDKLYEQLLDMIKYHENVQARSANNDKQNYLSNYKMFWV